MNKRWIKIVIGVLVGLLLGWLLARRPAVAEPPPTRAHTQTWAVDVFSLSQDVHLSPVARVPFPFNAAGLHFKPSGIAGFFLSAELRLRADGADWSPWYPIDEFEPQADGRLYGENLVAWPQAREVQVQIKTLAPLTEALGDLTVIAIDSRDGPTTAQARSSAETRAAEQAAPTSAGPGVPRPTVIRRADWGADESWMTWTPEYAPVDKMMLHHTVSGGGNDPAADVRAVYYYHAVVRNWGDIGYNFLVDKFGNVYEGRYGGPDVIGAHVAYWNEGSLGVSVLGCYDNSACTTVHNPTPATLDAIADMAAWTASRQAIDPRVVQDFSNGYNSVTNYVLAGHRDYGSTVCPGGNLYAELPYLRLLAWENLPDYDVRFGWHNTPVSLEAGQSVTVYPNLSNYGRLVWSDATGVRLGYRWLKDGQVVAERAASARIIPDAVVNFGEMTALVAQLQAPLAPGVYTLRWDFYHEGVGWFADQPAPAGRSQALDLTVEVLPTLALDMRLSPSDVVGGAQFGVGITLEGPMGQDFEVYTALPQATDYVAGSGQSDPGVLYLEPSKLRWAGTLGATPGQANFSLRAPAGLSVPLALSITATLDVAGNDPLVVQRWFIIDGYHSYLPLVLQD